MKRILCLWFPHRLQPPSGGEPVSLSRNQGHGPLAREKPRDRSAHDRPAHDRPAHDRPAHDRLAHDRLAQWCAQFSPTVGWEPAAVPTAEQDSLLLDITATAALFGGEEALAACVATALGRRRLAVRLAIADTIGAAWALAHYGTDGVETTGATEGLAAGGLDTAGQASRGTQVLAPLPIAALPITALPITALPITALRLPDDVVAQLHELGIERIGQLAALPRPALAARFPRQLLLRLDQASGAAAEPIVAYRPPPLFVACCELEHPAARRDAVAAVLRGLIDQVAEQLAQQRQGALALHCRLVCQRAEWERAEWEVNPLADGGASIAPVGENRRLPPIFSTGCGASAEPVEFSVGLFSPTCSPPHLAELVDLQLERIVLAGPVTTVELAVVQAAALEQRQRRLPIDELDDPNGRDRGQRLAALVDRLSSRLGREAVVRPRLVADAQPEYALRYEPLVGYAAQRRPAPKRHPAPQRRRAAAKPSRGAASARRSAGVWERPLWLCRPPARLRVVAVAPDGSPVRFCHDEVEHHVARCLGPERIETGWWRGRQVRRDYYRVETTHGGWFWLFRQRADGRWFLQGEFG